MVFVFVLQETFVGVSTRLCDVSCVGLDCFPGAGVGNRLGFNPVIGGGKHCCLMLGTRLEGSFAASLPCQAGSSDSTNGEAGPKWRRWCRFEEVLAGRSRMEPTYLMFLRQRPKIFFFFKIKIWRGTSHACWSLLILAGILMEESFCGCIGSWIHSRSFLGFRNQDIFLSQEKLRSWDRVPKQALENTI